MVASTSARVLVVETKTMITVCAWREKSYLDPKTEWNIWSNLTRAYGIDVLALIPFEQYDLPSTDDPVVVLDEDGQILLEDFEWPDDFVLVTGRSLQNIDHLPGTHVRIPIHKTDVFGMCCVAIALEDWRRKK